MHVTNWYFINGRQNNALHNGTYSNLGFLRNYYASSKQNMAKRIMLQVQSFKSDGPQGVWGRSIIEMFRAPKNLQLVYSQQGHLKAFYKFTKRADTI